LRFRNAREPFMLRTVSDRGRVMRKVMAGLTVLLLAACGPAYAPLNAPTVPCATISQAEYQTFRDNGAASAVARIHESGMVDMTAGPGVVHCATFNSSIRPCRRPNDFVIAYTLEDGSQTYVHVPPNTEYRFVVRARPTTCQVLAP
jgi:acetyl esterase/lipase